MPKMRMQVLKGGGWFTNQAVSLRCAACNFNPPISKVKFSSQSFRIAKEYDMTKSQFKLDEPKARECPSYYQTPPVTQIGKLAELLSYNAGNALCYIWRADKKPGSDPIEDISKAIDHLIMERDRLRALATQSRVNIECM